MRFKIDRLVILNIETHSMFSSREKKIERKGFLFGIILSAISYAICAACLHRAMLSAITISSRDKGNGSSFYYTSE